MELCYFITYCVVCNVNDDFGHVRTFDVNLFFTMDNDSLYRQMKLQAILIGIPQMSTSVFNKYKNRIKQNKPKLYNLVNLKM